MAGCRGFKLMEINVATGFPGGSTTQLFLSSVIEVFILSMPLVGVNFDVHRSSNWTDHWWFQHPGGATSKLGVIDT